MKAKYKNLLRSFKFKPVVVVFFAVANCVLPSFLSAQNKNLSYSFFAEGGETESVFEIDGRSFPVKIGSLGLKGTMSPNETTNIYGKLGFGYSQKQSVSAYDYNLSGSVLATSFGGGANKKFPIRNSNFVVMPFIDMSIFNYSSNTFRGKRNDALLKADVKGNTSFLRSGLELQYLTQNGHFFFGAGANSWDVENAISIITDNLTITPKVWADSIDSFFQTGVVFDTGNSNAVLGMRISDLTFDINTQLVEIFAEVQLSFGQ
jgi:hypothetical protein